MADAFDMCQQRYTQDPSSSSAAANTISLLMHVFVALVSGDTNVARHLVEREQCMPRLFSLLRTGAPSRPCTAGLSRPLCCLHSVFCSDVLLPVLKALPWCEPQIGCLHVLYCGMLPMTWLACVADPVPACLSNVSALLMVLIRDCKISKPMLITTGVPAIIAVLKQHSSPAVSVTTVQVCCLSLAPRCLSL